MSAPTVFLSAVTKDFGLPFLEDLRVKIGDSLDCFCRYRGNLKPGGGILPEKLRREIESADCVIHLVGPSFGFGPADVLHRTDERTPAGEYWKSACRKWWPDPDLPARRSYTQMEYDFAIELSRPVYVIFVDDPSLVAAAAAQDATEADLQAAHRRAIKAFGHDYVKAESLATLTAITEKLPYIVQHLKDQIADYRDFMASVDGRLANIETAVVSRPTSPDPPIQLPTAASHFVGRANLVADLAARLRKDKQIDIWGGPGMGKTALTAAALKTIIGEAPTPDSLIGSPFPHGVVFLDLYTIYKGSLDNAWHALANAFDPSLPTDMPARDRAARACLGRRALVILEGAEELKTDLTTFVSVLAPESTRLVLTRDEKQTAASRRIRLTDWLDDADALDLLRHLTREAGAVTDSLRADVQTLLGGHPLALTWAGSQLADATQPPGHFLRDLRAAPFKKLTEPGGDILHTLEWTFDRGVEHVGESARTTLAAAARVSEPFDADLAAAAGGGETDLQRLVQYGFLRIAGDEGWAFAHALAGQYARQLPLPQGVLPALGRWAIAGLTAGDAYCVSHQDVGPLGQAIAHAATLLGHDSGTRDLEAVVIALINHHGDTIGIRRGRLDFARRALEAAQHWFGLASDDEKASPDWQRNSSVILDRLGNLAVAQGDGTGAARRFTESLAIAERLAASDPANAVWQRDLFISWSKVSDLAVAQGDLPKAQEAYEKVLEVNRHLAASDPANAAWQRDLSVSLNRLGDLAVAQGDGAGAARRFTESLAIRERLAASDPANAAWQRDLFISWSKVSDLAVAQGDLPKAQEAYEKVLEVNRRLAASDPANAAWQRDLSVSLNKLGDLAVAQGDGAAAALRFTESLAIAERLAASDPANAEWQRDLSVSLNKLGDLAVAQGDGAGAARRFSESLAIRERLAASDPANAAWQRDLAVSHFKLAQVAQENGDDAAAVAALRACFAVLEGMKQRGMHLDPPMAQLHEQLAEVFGGGDEE